MTPPLDVVAELVTERMPCWTRRCAHIRIEWLLPLHEQHGESFVCVAFPRGIPRNIANGTSLHMRVHPTQHGRAIFTPARPLKGPR